MPGASALKSPTVGIPVVFFLLLLLNRVEEVEAQWRGSSPFVPFLTEGHRSIPSDQGWRLWNQEEGSAPGRSFLGRVGVGSLAGVVSGAFLGSIISDWSLPGGAGLGLVTGTMTGLVVAVVAQDGTMTKRRGFLIGSIPAYAYWLAIGAPAEFVLDPLFLFGIPGWHAGKGPRVEPTGMRGGS